MLKALWLLSEKPYREDVPPERMASFISALKGTVDFGFHVLAFKISRASLTRVLYVLGYVVVIVIRLQSANGSGF